MSDLAGAGSLRSIGKIPADMKRLFATAQDVPWPQHLAIQAAFQRHTDNSVSKTINLRTEASVDDVRKIFLSAHRLGLKGITVYRYGTKRGQALSFAEEPSKGEAESPVIAAAPEYSGGCVSGTCIF